jgi:hypothetical protein
MSGWQMNDDLEGSRHGLVSSFSRRDWGKPRNRIQDSQCTAKIRAKYFLNTSQESYCCANPFCIKLFKGFNYVYSLESGDWFRWSDMLRLDCFVSNCKFTLKLMTGYAFLRQEDTFTKYGYRYGLCKNAQIVSATERNVLSPSFVYCLRKYIVRA